MFAICVEASYKKGMGHLFRMLNFVEVLKRREKEFIFFINNDEKVKYILLKQKIAFKIVNLEDTNSNWESTLIEKYQIKFWINDRLDTSLKHAENILSKQVKLITFDDLGSGAKLSDIHVCGLFFNKGNLEGKKILAGISYLILNSEISKFKKKRKSLNNIFVSLGGSDTYGVTFKVLNLLKRNKISATIHIGPNFKDRDKLKESLTNNYKLIEFVPSFIEELYKYDLAITGGGITPFEANASGLPCMIIANELFEIDNAKFLDSLGSSYYLGFHKNIEETLNLNLEKLPLNKMSEKGLENFELNAKEKIYEEIVNL